MMSSSRLGDTQQATVDVRKNVAMQQNDSFGNDNYDTAMTREAHKAVHTLDTTNMKPINELRRSVILTAAAFGMICASTSYAFNLFSGSLQRQYNFDSRAMSTINTVGMVFAYFLVPYGIIYDYFGPLPIYILACTLFTLGALLMGLSFQGIIDGSVVRFAVFNALLSLGSQLFDLASIVTIFMVFPTRSGFAVAILKTLLGLGSAIIGSIQIGFFRSTPAYYFYFLIGLVLVVGVVVMCVVKMPSYELTGYEYKHLTDEAKAKRVARRAAYLTQDPPMLKFYVGIAVILVLVVYLPTTSAMTAFLSVSQHTSMVFAIVAIIITAMLLLMLIPCPALERIVSKRDSDDGSNDVDVEPIGQGDDNTKTQMKRRQSVATDIDYIAPQYQTRFTQSLKTLKLWAAFWTVFCGVGAEFVIIFNARFIYAALDGKPVGDTVGTLLTVLNGVGSALGRMVMSYFEASTQGRKAEERVPITIAFFVPTALITVSMVLFLVLPGRSLLVAYSLAAFGNGFCVSIPAVVIRTIHAADCARHYRYIESAAMIAALLLNRLLYGEWYAVQADKRGETVCLDRACVQTPLIVLLALNVSALIADVYVHVCYRRFSRAVLAERQRMPDIYLDTSVLPSQPNKKKLQADA